MLGKVPIFMLLIITLAISAVAAETESVELQMPALFTDHMVLQRNDKLPVWGWSNPGQTITVSLNGKSATATAGIDGKWTAWLPPMKAGGPYELVIRANKEITIKDVLIGDVWLCSGQSNMEWILQNTINAKEEISSASNPMLRMIKVPHTAALMPCKDFSGQWKVCKPNNVGYWTAVGYYFAKYIQQTQNVPVGIIGSYWGGTRVESWTSLGTLKGLPEARKVVSKQNKIAGLTERKKEILKEQEKVYNKARKKLASFEKSPAHQKKYSNPAFDDSAWKDITTPSDWNNQGFSNYTGEAWYRKTVEIPAEWAGKELLLSPGAIDEIETTFFNGIKVGGRGSYVPYDVRYWHQKRVYKVPASQVKQGKAVIAIRVINMVGAGGLTSNGEATDMYLKPADGSGQPIALSGKWKIKFTLIMPETPDGLINQHVATSLHHGMIDPLLPFPIKGVIWYQGESNTRNAYDYRILFPALIQDWRNKWNKQFPFLWVQLANYQSPKNTEPVKSDGWAVLRESQNHALKLCATATALAIDIGNDNDIHPRNKRDVGHRLSLAARKIAYGEDIVHSGPTYKKMEIEGSKIRLFFDNIGGGLVAKGGELKRFSIANVDGKFYWADAVIDGDTVVVSSEKVHDPLAVRYAFEINPKGANLYNKEGLPASPFRTDTWNVPTQNQ